MKHNLETLTMNFTQAELARVKKELQEKVDLIEKANLVYNAKTLTHHLKEILG